MINQTLWCVTYWADFAIWSLPAKYNFLNEQNLSSLKFWCLISFYKRALLQFCSIHDTLQSTRFTPLQCQLVKFCICAEVLDTKLSEKSNFETPDCGKVSRLEAKTKIVLVLLLSFYLFIWPYLFIFWSVRFSIKFVWNFFISISILTKIAN